MANAKSTIYPVQLQGAELNLNKLDAEIKQYSGFNKNNSPFVGGCLSNVFKKNVTVEGAAEKNVYVTPEGDVYKVTNEGLFKNDEKLVDYTGKKFYNVEEFDFDFPSNTLYFLDTNVYITAEMGDTGYDIILNAYNPFKEEMEQIVIFEDFLKEEEMYLDAKYCKNDNSMIVAVSYASSVQGGWTDPRAGGWLMVYRLEAENDISKVYEYQVNNSEFRYMPVHLELYGDNEGYITVLQNDWVGAYSWEGDDGNHFGYNFTFDMSGDVTFTGFLDMPTSTSGDELATWFSINNVSYNSAGARYKYTEDTFYGFFGRGTTPLQNLVWKGKYYIKKGELFITESKDYGQSTTGNNASLIIFNKSGALVSYVGKTGLCDYPSFGINGSRHDAGAVVGGCILYNNQIISGVCLPSGYVLATEWNTVKEAYKVKFDYEYEGSENNIDPNAVCVFKTFDNKWYKLVESEPFIKVVENQVICNVDFYNNAYDLNRKKLMLFAPAWNNRTPGLANADLTGYVATAINEYDLENNPSLIINPVQVTRTRLIGNNDFINSVLEESCEHYIKYNFYSGETEIKYKWSSYLGLDRCIQSQNLIDLPFPSNTDGNVQYSPSLYVKKIGEYGNLVFILENNTVYKLMTYDNKAVMAYYLATAIEDLQSFFTIQGQLYGILNNGIYNFNIINEVASRGEFIVDVTNLQFIGNTPYEALFFSKTNRCLYSFTGANVLNQKQLVDKISEVRNYLYNPATQTVFLITDIGVLFYGLFGMFLLEYTDITNIFLLDNGIVMSDNNGNYHYIKYYIDEGDTDYTKENIRLETCFYGMNNEVVTINDCLYIRLFSEEHEEGLLKVKATTISLKGRQTEETTFKIKASDWDEITHTIYLRYQPKTQRGLGISFSVDSPFKIASMSVGSQPDAVLVDKVSKGAITAPSVTTNNDEW